MFSRSLLAQLFVTLALFGAACTSGRGGDEAGGTGRGDMAGPGATDGTGGQTGRGGAAGQGGRGSGGTGGQGGRVGMGGAGGARDQLGLCRIELTCATEISDAPKVTCDLTIVDPAGMTIYDDAAGVELRGRSSLEYPKQNYGVELRTAAGAENPVAMMGMGKEADWILDGSWLDRSFMRNDLVFALYREMGRYAPESRFCTLELDGRPRGIYRLSEKIKRDDDRVAIPADDGMGKSFIVSQDEDGVLDFPVGTADNSGMWELVYPKQAMASAGVRSAVQTWLDGLRRALTGTDPGNPITGVPAFLDLDATADFILIQELSKNIDAYNLSLTLSRNDGAPAAFVPWDFDLSFGQPTTRTGGNDLPSGWVQGRTMLIDNLCRVPSLLARLGARWRELRASPLSDHRVLEKLDAFQAVLSPQSIDQNFALWPISEVDFRAIYRPYSLYRVHSYSEEVARFREWVTARLVWMDAHIDRYPN